jgi:hypothetical protein
LALLLVDEVAEIEVDVDDPGFPARRFCSFILVLLLVCEVTRECVALLVRDSVRLVLDTDEADLALELVLRSPETEETVIVCEVVSEILEGEGCTTACR